MTRTATCCDCSIVITAGARGPLPKRCPSCRRRRKAEIARAYRERNPGAHAAAQAKYIRETLGLAAHAAKNREHRRANPELYAAYAARRRAIIRGADAELFSRRQIADRDDWLCGLCFESIDPEAAYPDPLSLSLDHVVPLARGGEHTWDNVRATHLRCNCRRGARLRAIDVECLPTPEQIERMYEQHIEHMFDSDEEAA